MRIDVSTVGTGTVPQVETYFFYRVDSGADVKVRPLTNLIKKSHILNQTVRKQPYQSVLRIRIRDLVLYLIPGSGMKNQDLIFENFVSVFLVKNTKIL
jgi:hypothetical protein